MEAFKATLEESASSDVLLHVIDLSSSQMEKQIQVVENLIKEFGWNNKPLIHVFNKTDSAPFQKRFHIKQHPRVFTSAETGEGLDELKTLMTQSISEQIQLNPKSLENQKNLENPEQKKLKTLEHKEKNPIQSISQETQKPMENKANKNGIHSPTKIKKAP